MKNLLEVQDLNIKYLSEKSTIHAVKNLDFSLKENEICAFIGQSGCGKSSFGHAIIGLLDENAKQSGKIIFENINLLELCEKEKRKIRGKKISMIFQDPFSYLNPTMKIGKQILEAIWDNPKKEKVYFLLNEVGFLDSVLRYNQYPHEMSGGMRQRVMIAIALASNPKIIIADEPTTSLDLNTQMQFLKLLKKINKKYNTSIIFITHDITLADAIASKI